MVNFTWIDRENKKSITITEQNGYYDLTNINDFENVLIKMTPGDTYYPNTYIMPENLSISIPERTERFKEIDADYISQHFLIKVPENSGTYSMTFKLSGRHAMRVYLNGELIAQNGQAGTTKQDTEVWENNISFYGASLNGEIDIILHSAQFYHAKRGASLAELSLSKTETDSFFLGRIKGMVISGAFLCAAVLLLSIYLLLSRTPTTLYFSAACVVMALRECLQSQAWIYLPISGGLSFILEYLSVVLLTIFLTLYLTQYTSGKFLRVVKYTAILGSCVYGICVLFGDSIFYTSMLKYYQILLIISIVPGIAVLFWKMRNSTKEQITAIYGIGVFFLAAIYDIIMYSDIFGDSSNKSISEAAMLIFMIAQTVSLFQMNNRVLTEAREHEKKLETEKITLESINRLKTEFLGNVSHELKSPLTVMSGYAQTTKQLAQNSNLPEHAEISRRMSLISSEAERLSLMVSQILDITRIDEGRMIMVPLKCYADEIIHSTVETHYPILNKNQNRLDIKIEKDLPALYADPTRISQVIVNLISNAVRSTSNGVITISASKENDKIQFCVSDTGSGINSVQIQHLFERYSKIQLSSSGQDTGTGLGLYICKHIIEQHGGEIWIESQESKGTSVFFTLSELSVNNVPC